MAAFKVASDKKVLKISQLMQISKVTFDTVQYCIWYTYYGYVTMNTVVFQAMLDREKNKADWTNILLNFFFFL